jgi:three-Cys-motif partner protein
MGGMKDTIWPAEPHTLAKHEILGRYLNAWFPIMGRWNGRIIYIDGFAGPGKYKNGEPGSPIIALERAQNHKNPLWKEIVFLFIEIDEERCSLLKTLVESTTQWSPKFSINIENAAFGDVVPPILDAIDVGGGRLAPTFAFVDPFGWKGVPFKLLSRILGYRRCEVLITFMFEEISRFLSNQDQWANFTSCYGNEGWRGALGLSKGDRERFLVDGYCENLRTMGKARYVLIFRMINIGNKTDYYMVFATNDILGLDRMKGSMWKLDPSGNFQFSDVTAYSGQIDFSQPDYTIGRDAIFEKFRGRTVSIKEVEHFVIAETPFYSGNYKTPILKELMEDVDPPFIRVKGRKRERSGWYPKGCLITFADKMK